MKISVFGLGYVGCVSAACLANDGHFVIGVDVDQRKVEAIQAGRSPFFEPGLEELLRNAREVDTLHATVDATNAVNNSEAALICVGTPSARTGEIELKALRSVLSSIGEALRTRVEPFMVILRSTVMPHVVQDQLIPLLEKSIGHALNDKIQFCYNPEFLREGSAIRDFYEAPMVVVGRTSDRAADVLTEIYSRVQAPVVYTDIRTACLVKYVCNALHALKVAFANEVGQLSEALGADGRRVMEIVCMDTKLNISPMYMKPGFAFGGSCLPKDLRAIMAESRFRGLSVPLIQSVLPSNKSHLDHCLQTVMDTGEKHISIFGLAFKEGTDDLRESPAVDLIEALIGKGFHVAIHDPAVTFGSIHGANLAFIERSIPHIWKLMVPSMVDLLKNKVVVLLKKPDSQEMQILKSLRDDQACLDFANSVAVGDLRATTLATGIRTPALV